MNNHLKIAGIAGLVTPFLTFGLILSAIASWPPFNWSNNALSDLGVQSGNTALLFNSGLVIGGLLFLISATGLFPFISKKVVGKVGAAVLVLATVSMIGIGIFNENYSPTHYILSVAFFMLFPIAMLVLVGAFWIEGKRKLSLFTLAMALVAGVVWGLQLAIRYVPNVAIPEFVSGLFGAAWTMTISYLMLKKSQNRNII
jgi:hypothetical membrane protein